MAAGAWWYCCCGGDTGAGVTTCPGPVTGGTSNHVTPTLTLEWRALTPWEIVEGAASGCYAECGETRTYLSTSAVNHGLSSLGGCEIVTYRGYPAFDCACFDFRLERTAVASHTASAHFELHCGGGVPSGSGWYACETINPDGTAGPTGYAKTLGYSGPSGWTMKVTAFGRCTPDPCGGRWLYSTIVVQLVGSDDYTIYVGNQFGSCETGPDDETTAAVGGSVTGWYCHRLTAGDTAGCMPGGSWGWVKFQETLPAPQLFGCPYVPSESCCGSPATEELLTWCV